VLNTHFKAKICSKSSKSQVSNLSQSQSQPLRPAT
jgi:hypothetical protein